MLSFDIGIEARASKDQIRSVVKDWFPSLCVHDSDELMRLKEGPFRDITINVMDHDCEFRTKVEFYAFPGAADDTTFYPVVREVARMFSEKFGCRSICEAIGYGDPEGYPGTSIVWDGGRAFLADNYGTDYGDGEGGAVRIVRPISVDAEQDRSVLMEVVCGGV